jgi:uncharacterized protein (TIGR02246 family)
MRQLKIVPAFILAALFGGFMTDPASAQAIYPETADTRAIQRLSADWIAAMNAKDIAKLLTMMTEDIVFLPPGLPPIRGKKAVEAMYKGFFPQFSTVEQTSVLEEVEVAGDWAFIWGTESSVLVLQAGQATIQMEGRGLSILKRQSDGTWRFARSLSNSAPRPARQQP